MKVVVLALLVALLTAEVAAVRMQKREGNCRSCIATITELEHSLFQRMHWPPAASVLSQRPALSCCCWSRCSLLHISPEHQSRTLQYLNNQAKEWHIWLQVPLVWIYSAPVYTARDVETSLTVCIPGRCYHCRGCGRSNLWHWEPTDENV